MGDLSQRLFERQRRLRRSSTHHPQDKGRDRLLLIRIVPWKTPLPKEHSEAWAYSPDNPDFKRPGIFKPVPATGRKLCRRLPCDRRRGSTVATVEGVAGRRASGYAELLAPHAQAHAALFNRVTLDLGGGADRAKTTEELLDLAKTRKTVAGGTDGEDVRCGPLYADLLGGRNCCRICRASGPARGSRPGRAISPSTPMSRPRWPRRAARTCRIDGRIFPADGELLSRVAAQREADLRLPGIFQQRPRLEHGA